MKKILVIADQQEGRQHAFSKAVSLAKKTGAIIHVAIFLYEPTAVLAFYQLDGDEVDLKIKLIEYKEQWWDKFIKDNRQGLYISHEVVWQKNIATWIVKHSRNFNYDLIVKTGHRSETTFYTPTDWQLFRHSMVPVYSVAPNPAETKKTMLVALDLLSKSAEKNLLNKRLLEHAFSLSIELGSELHCAYVIKIPTLLKELDLIDNHVYIRKAKKEVKERLATLMQDFDLPPDCIHIEQGEPWGALSKLANKLQVNCVVVGSMGRKGISGKLIGNTAEKIIRVVNTDLLVISPET